MSPSSPGRWHKPPLACSTRLGVRVWSKLTPRSFCQRRYSCQDIQIYYNWTNKTLQRDCHTGSLSSEDLGNLPLGVSYKNHLEPIFYYYLTYDICFLSRGNGTELGNKKRETLEEMGPVDPPPHLLRLTIAVSSAKAGCNGNLRKLMVFSLPA